MVQPLRSTLDDIILFDIFVEDSLRSLLAIDDLASSLQTFGLFHPISVVVIKGGYKLACGNRRFAAATKLGWPTIRANIYPVGTSIEAIRIHENDQREQLGPLELAEEYDRLLQSQRGDYAAVAKLVCRDKRHVQTEIRLLNLIQPFAVALTSGLLHPGHARCLAKLPAVTQERFHSESLVIGNVDHKLVSLEDLKNTIRKYREPRPLEDMPWRKMEKAGREEFLLDGAPACRSCPNQTGYQRGLFDDLDGDKRDYCLDSACCDAKVKAWLARCADKCTKRTGKSPVLITLSLKERCQIIDGTPGDVIGEQAGIVAYGELWG